MTDESVTDLGGDELLELLLDLKHDLGKYLRLPVAMLPPRASQAELRGALREALFATRRRDGRVRGARELWEAFAAEAGAALQDRPGFERLRAAIDTALGWERAIGGETGGDVGPETGGGEMTGGGETVGGRAPRRLNRRDLERDLGAVGRAIGDLIEDIKHEGRDRERDEA